MSGDRGPWYLVTGLVIGLLLGLVYAWLVNPVEYDATPPASLTAQGKDNYRLMIAVAFTANPDLVRARERLKLLKDENPERALTGQAQRILAVEGSLEEARALGNLATALQKGVGFGGAPVTPTVQPEP